MLFGLQVQGDHPNCSLRNINFQNFNWDTSSAVYSPLNMRSLSKQFPLYTPVIGNVVSGSLSKHRSREPRQRQSDYIETPFPSLPNMVTVQFFFSPSRQILRKVCLVSSNHSPSNCTCSEAPYSRLEIYFCCRLEYNSEE